MKLSIEHFPFRNRFGEEKALEMIKKAGFDGVDYSFNALGNGTAIDLSDHIIKAQKIKKMLDGLELSCTQAHAPFCLKYGIKFNNNEKDFADMIKSIEFAGAIGVKQIVVHSIKMPENSDFFDYNFDYYKSLEPYAKDCGVQIAVENLVNSIFWKPNRLSQFIRLLDSPVFCACVDVGHAMLMGTPPEEFISGMDKGLLKCIHIHDTDGKVDRHWIPYQGVQNWDNIIKALADYDYNGEMNMEIVHCFDNLPDELYFPLLCYTAKVGKMLVNKFKEYKR
ncbi:MAG: sugar phosphate isomerase/epimerase [Clostridia bacterium]|nr:sugar phosphate isomerase/epimerase [Clostridia bacterium]